jgi:hypothetical protein
MDYSIQVLHNIGGVEYFRIQDIHHQRNWREPFNGIKY